MRSKVSNTLTNLRFSSVQARGANHASVSVSSVSPAPPLPACTLASSEWRRSDLMTRRHCFCNCAASDVDLSLALIAAPDGSASCVWGGGGRRWGGASWSPSGAQTGATGEIGIVLMGPRGLQNHKNVTQPGTNCTSDSGPAVLGPARPCACVAPGAAARDAGTPGRWRFCWRGRR